jgi:hypothetical protein
MLFSVKSILLTQIKIDNLLNVKIFYTKQIMLKLDKESYGEFKKFANVGWN